MSTTAAQLAIRSAKPTEVGRLSHVLTDAFLIAPIGDWLIPDVGERRKVYVNYFAIFVRHGLRYGVVEVNSDLTAVAIWQPRTHDSPPPDDYDTQLADACGPWADRFRILDATFDQQHPRGVFHHHLQFLAVSPTKQGKGIGTALLSHHHTWLDRDGIPAYLEASKTRNRDLYMRHNYHLHKPFHLPNDGPPIWPMWREPHAERTGTGRTDNLTTGRSDHQ